MKKVLSRRIIWHLVLWVIVLAGAAFILAGQFSSLRYDELWSLLRATGWRVLVILIPGIMLTLADGMGWAACLAGKGKSITLSRLFAIRISGDAVCNSVPAGMAAGEGIRSVLARDRCGIPLEETMSASLLGRVTMGFAHMLFICAVMVPLLSGVAGTVHFDRLPGGWEVLAAGTALTAVVLVGPMALFTGPRLSQALRALSRIPLEPIQKLAARAEPSITRMDEHVRAFLRDHRRHFWRSVLMFFVGWVALGSESALILALLGADVPLITGFAIEAAISVIRLVLFFLPSAVGAAEVVYTAILVSLGIPDAVTTAAAFIALKRSREVLWVGIGYGTLGRLWAGRKAKEQIAGLRP